MSIKEHLADGVRIGETPDDRYNMEFYNLSRESWDKATRDINCLLRDFNVNNVGVLVIPNITPTCAFEPKTATMLVNPLFFDEDADKDSFSIVGDGSDLSIRRGAIIHEIGHSLYSKFSLDAISHLDENVANIVITLEELRIEFNVMSLINAHKKFIESGFDIDLRRASHFIANENLPDGSLDPVEVSVAMALTVGRVDAGTLSLDASLELQELFKHEYGEEVFNALRNLWCEYLSITDRELDSRIAIAKAWLELIGQPSGDEKGEPKDGEGEGDEGEGEEGEGEGEGKSSGSSKSLNSKDVKSASEVGYQITETNLITENISRENHARRAYINSAEARKINRDNSAQEAYNKTHGYSEDKSDGSKLYRKPTKPTDVEAQALVTMSRQLERVNYVDKSKTNVNSMLPSGRLRGRTAVMAEAQKSRGQMITAEPWRTKKRKSVHKTPLTVGIIGDVSGSMGGSVESVSSISWVLSEAVNRVQGKSATILMGNTAYGLIKSGERHRLIPRYNASFGFEAFRDAFDAIDGTLNLTGGRGARILFIASDGHFVSSEHERYAWKAMKECRNNGVQVFWLDYDGQRDFNNYGHGEVINLSWKNPTEQAKVIGQIVVKTFDQVKSV